MQEAVNPRKYSSVSGYDGGGGNENRKYHNSDTCTCTHCVARVGCCENPPDFAKMWRVFITERGENH